MAVVVMKFGGTSLATPNFIISAARKVLAVRRNSDVVVVVSAMGETTDGLLQLSRKISIKPNEREMDMLLTVGERISVALMSMALRRLNLDAISFTGSQVGIITDTAHTNARIIEIKGDRIKKALDQKKIPVICGFQGVSLEKEITTLGRGGSDTTALALSATLNATRCIIYTDVDGVYTEDPNKFPDVRLIKKISYEEMMELTRCGAEVLHPRASNIAARFNIPVEIKNSFRKGSGTLITKLEGLEHPRPKAITHTEDLYLVTLTGVPKRPRYLSQIVTELARQGICLKFFFHGISEAKEFNLSFITLLSQREKAKTILNNFARKFKAGGVRELLDICSISLVGAGIGADNKILSETFNTLSRGRIHVEAVTTSELSINIFLKKKYLYRATGMLLEVFHLKS